MPLCIRLKKKKFFLKPFCECYCLNVIVNIDSSLNASVNTNLNITCSTFFFVHMQALNEKLKLMGRAKKSFSRWSLGLDSIALWSTKVFWKNFKSSPAPLSYMLNTIQDGPCRWRVEEAKKPPLSHTYSKFVMLIPQ